MKKNLLGWLAMAAMLVGTGCSTDEVVNDYSPENAIQFGTYVGRDASTRASATTTESLQNSDCSFGVFANYNQGEETGDKPNFMNNQQVTYSSGSWTYSPIKYWPNNSNANVCFWAYAPYNGENLNVSVEKPYFIIHDGIDYVATERVSSGKQDIDKEVTLSFAHVMSRVGFKVEAVIDELDNTHNSDINGKPDTDKGTGEKTIPTETTIVATKVTMTAGLKTKGTMTWTEGTQTTPEGWTLTLDSESTATSSYVLNVQNFADISYPSIEEVKNSDGSSTFNTLSGGGQEATTTPTVLNNESSYFMVIPQPVGMNIEVEYYVITRDESLKTGYSVVKNTVKTSDFDFKFERNHAYNFVLHLGLTSVKLNAEVSTWDSSATITDHIVNVPVNTITTP